MEHDITTAMTAEERDIKTPTIAAREARAESAGIVPTTEAKAPTIGAAVEAQRPMSYAFVPPDVWALARGLAAVLSELLPRSVRFLLKIVG